MKMRELVLLLRALRLAHGAGTRWFQITARTQ